MQLELFPLDQYGTAKCGKCGAVGTAVQMGICCRVKQASQNLGGTEESAAHLSTIRLHDTKRLKRKVA